MKRIPTENWKRLLELKQLNRIENLFVEYYEYADKSYATRVVVVINGRQIDGYAECSPKDRYVKPYGRNMAAGRVLKKIIITG